MTQDPTVDPDLIDLVDRFFGDRSTQQAVDAAEETGLPVDMWEAANELGLTGIGIDERGGGSGGTLLDAVAVLRVAARHATPLPLAEHHTAAWLLASAGEPVPTAPLTVATDPRDTVDLVDGRARGRLHAVPWLPGAAGVVTVSGPDLVHLSAAQLTPSGGRDLAGVPCSDVELDDVEARVVPSLVDQDAMAARAALARAAQLTGVIEAVSELTQSYVSQRVQFGKPVGSFQAVQHHLVTIAQAAAMSALTVDQAAVAASDREARFEIAATKLVVSESASQVARSAHQAHGAIGMTREYRLQQFTRRLMAWRSSDGAERPSAVALGRAVAAAPSLSRLISDDRPQLEELR